MPASILAVLLDHTMNTHFLSQVQWCIVLTDSIWTPFDPWNMLYHRQQAPQHLERRFCHKGKSTFGSFVLDQTMNAHFLSPLQWLILLHGFTWEPFHPWKTLYHVPKGSSIPGKTVLQWTPVSIVAVLLDHTMNTHFLSQVQWCIVLIDFIWTLFDPWNMFFHGQQGSSTPEKTVLP